jgi:integrase
LTEKVIARQNQPRQVQKQREKNSKKRPQIHPVQKGKSPGFAGSINPIIGGSISPVGDTDDDKWVPYLYRQHWLKKLCARAGVKQFGFHGIRHLFASILASKNVPLVEIQKMLRHGSIATTQRYIHSLQEGSREAIEALPGLESVKVCNQLKERKGR